MRISEKTMAGDRYIHHSQIYPLQTLDWSNSQELMAHPALPAQEMRLLGAAAHKLSEYPERFPDSSYEEDLSLFIMAELLGRQALAYCGMVNAWNRSGLCSQHKFCPYCAYREQNRRAERYASLYDKYGDQLFWVTCSYDGGEAKGHAFDQAYQWVADELWTLPWDAMKLVYENGVIEGALMSRELSIPGLMPLRALAHTHAIIHSQEVAETLKTELETHMEASPAFFSVNEDLELDPHFGLKPDILVEEVGTEKTFFNRLKYMFKPFTVSAAYRSGLLHARGPSEMRLLNQDLDDAVTGYSYVTERKQKCTALGSLTTRIFKNH